MKDYNSSINQKIKEKFVNREILCNVGPEVEFILSADSPEAPYQWDDVENIYQSDIDQLMEFIEWELDINELLDLCEFFDVKKKDVKSIDPQELQEYLEENHRFEAEPAEIYEWWKVTSYLAEKLHQKGHPVILHSAIWGRCGTGQAILLDHVISEICEEMEILDGQKNDWSK